MVSLRPATIDDAELLLSWRNDPETRARSHVGDVIPLSEHVAWLRKTLENPTRELFVAESDGEPVGTVRADQDGKFKELSWTIAPFARKRGLAKEMVKLAAGQVEGPLRAEIKPDNIASIRVAMCIGMRQNGQIDGVLHYVLER